MTFDEYQLAAKQTDTIPKTPTPKERLAFLVLGLTDEIGQLSSLLKKALRNDIGRAGLKTDILARLGDSLWYIAAITTEFDEKLSNVVASNLNFIEDRWKESDDDLFSPRREFRSESNERLPEKIKFKFERQFEDGMPKVRLTSSLSGQVGDIIDDNEYIEDNYRFHDVIHIGFMTHFKWSPVFRKLLSKKRKSSALTDRVEDGAKARDIEEAMARIIFVYMEENAFLLNSTSVDTTFLRMLRKLSGNREVSLITEASWEKMILSAAQVIRDLMGAGEGVVTADLKRRRLTFKACSTPAFRRI